MLSNNYIEIVLVETYRTLFLKNGFLNWWPGDTDFEICIGAILTQNTSWTNVEKAIKNLKNSNNLDCDAILNIKIEKLGELIRPSGYFRQKAGYLKNFCEFLKLHTINQLKVLETEELRQKVLAVKGIGKETADSILLYALNKPVFVVDTYTKRLFSRIGIVKENISYDEMQKIFYDNLKDTEIYNDFHAQIVIHGKNYCQKKPKCYTCPLKMEAICRFYKS